MSEFMEKLNGVFGAINEAAATQAWNASDALDGGGDYDWPVGNYTGTFVASDIGLYPKKNPEHIRFAMGFELLTAPDPKLVGKQFWKSFFLGPGKEGPSWDLARLKGMHSQVFDCPAPEGDPIESQKELIRVIAEDALQTKWSFSVKKSGEYTNTYINEVV